MKITHLSTYEFLGGAARSAFRLHEGLRRIGQESTLFVQHRHSEDPTVVMFAPPVDFATRVRRASRRYFLQQSRTLHHARHPDEAKYFLDDRSEHRADVLGQIPPSDILHLHWIAGFLEYTDFFRTVPEALPLVWTLHDMDPFTGGCGHARGCRKFLECCGECPLLGSLKTKDYAYAIWKRKHAVFSRMAPNRLCIVTPSRWLAIEARQSALMGKFSINVIPYGVDTQCFRVRDRDMAREFLGVPPNAKVLLFVAHAFDDNYKGFPALLEAIDRVRGIPDLFLLILGRGRSQAQYPVPSRSLGFVHDEMLVSLAYSAADLFVLPTLMDNFPNTALEALACGLPVVASDVGGVPEIVRDGCTGLLVEPENSGILAAAIKNLLNDPHRRRQMSVNCRRIAVDEYSLEIQASRYMELYASLLHRNSGATPKAQIGIKATDTVQAC